MKSFIAKPHEVERKWYVIDAEGKNLGRLASEVASILRGKKKPIFTPHVDTGDYVIIVNAEKIAVTGNKMKDKVYKHHTGYPGGLKEITLEKIYQEIFSSLDKEMDHISDNIRQQISLSGEAFADADGEDREILQKFDLICRLSADIYIKKLLIERILDEHI